MNDEGTPMIKTEEKKERYAREVKSYQALNSAIRVVITYMLVDAFELQEEESMWVHHSLGSILEPLIGSKVKGIPSPVRDELLGNTYSTMLAQHSWSNTITPNNNSQQASVQDWGQVLANIIFECYELRPLYSASLSTQFVGLLLELGVGDPQNPRPSQYLPNALRYQMNK